MLPLLEPPSKEVDVEFLVFVQRYATDLLRWDILTFFAAHPDFCGPVAKVAQRLARPTHSIQLEMRDLALLGILKQEQAADNQPVYCLTQDTYLRGMTLKFSN